MHDLVDDVDDNPLDGLPAEPAAPEIEPVALDPELDDGVIEALAAEAAEAAEEADDDAAAAAADAANQGCQMAIARL